MGRTLKGKSLVNEAMVKHFMGSTTLIILEIAFEPVEEG